MQAPACFGHQTLSPMQTDATMLANNPQHCWMLHVVSVCTPCCMLLRKVWNRSNFWANNSQHFFVPWSPKRNNVGSLCIALPTLRTIHGLFEVYKVLWVVSCPRCTAGPNIVGSYRILLHTTANQDAAIPNTVGNIVGPTSHVSLNVKFTGHIEKAYSGTIKQLKSP